jgi:Chaperone of endosialidase
VSAGSFIGVNNLGSNQYSIDNLGLVINGNSIEQNGYGQIGYSDVSNSVLMLGSNIYNGASNTYGLGINNDVRSSNQFFLGRDNIMRDTDSYSIGYNLAADSSNNFLFGYNNNTQQPDAFIIGRDVTNKWRDNIAIGIGFTPDKDSAIQLGITDPALDFYRGVINIRRNTELQLDGSPGNPGEILMSNGAGSTPIWNTASSLGSMNFSLGSVGSTPSITASASLGGTIILNIPNASATATGLLRSSDWNTFNNKINLTSLSVTGWLLSYNNSTWVFGWTGTTTSITEWTNLYFTNLRAQNALSGTINTINTNIATATGNIAILTTNLSTTNSNLATATGNIATLSWNLSTLSGNLALTNTNLATLSGVVATKISFTSLSWTWGIAYNNLTGQFSDLLTFWSGLSRIGNTISLGTLTGGSLTGFTAGQIAFGRSPGGLSQSANLFWDITNNRLGIGTATPQQALDVNGTMKSTKYLLASDLSLIPIAGSQSALTSWWWLQLVGNKQSTVDYTPIAYWAAWAYWVIIPNQQLASVALMVRWAPWQTGNLTQWENASGALLSGINSVGNFGIGTAPSASPLDVGNQSGNSIARFTTYGNTNDIDMRRAQWTLTAPTAAGTAGTILGRVLWSGYNGSTYLNGASLSMETDSTTSAVSMPGRIVFSTSASGSSTPTERMRINSLGNVGIGTNTPATTLQVAWDIRVGTTGTNGCIQGFGGATIAWVCSSDERLKREVNDISWLLSKWDGLRVVNYKWNTQAENLYQNDTDTTQIGYLAQNVESLFPELVSTNKEGYKQVNYSALSIYSAEAIRELSTSKADSGALVALSNTLDGLRARVDAITGSTIVENYYTSIADTYVTTGSTVIHNYNLTSTGMESTHDMVIVDQVRAESIGILDVYVDLSSRITALFDVILEITVLKLTALRWYFEEIYAQKIFTREITTEKLCLKKANGVVSCFSAEEIEASIIQNNAPSTITPPVSPLPPPSDNTPPSSGSGVGDFTGSMDTGSLELSSSPSGSSEPPASDTGTPLVVSGE